MRRGLHQVVRPHAHDLERRRRPLQHLLPRRLRPPRRRLPARPPRAVPTGATSNSNLQPACERDHKAKHADGFGVTGTSEGAVFHTRAGFRHPVTAATQPTGRSIVADDLFDFQYSATEIVDALTHLAALQHTHRPGPSALVDEIWTDAA